MKLSEWMDMNAITAQQFADKVGASRDAVRKWRYGKRVPRSLYLRRIFRTTLGKVGPNDFVDMGGKKWKSTKP